MPAGASSWPEAASQRSTFTTTHWSVVLAARGADSPQAAEALESLCRVYWYPLYAYLRRRGQSPPDAEDLLQGFFVRFLESDFLDQVDRGKGRFRSFLLAALNHFLANEWDKANRQKRGGQVRRVSFDRAEAEGWYADELASELTPEKLYEQRWACALLERVMQRLEKDSRGAAKGDAFGALKEFLTGDSDSLTYAGLAQRLGISEAAAKMRVQRLRHHYQRLLRQEIAQTVAGPEEVEEELRHLFSILGG